MSDVASCEGEGRLDEQEEGGVGGTDTSHHQELQEMLLIVETNAIVDPGTVVVHPSNAPPTRLAMVGARGLH